MTAKVCSECGDMGLVYERYLQEWVTCRACDHYTATVAPAVPEPVPPLISNRSDGVAGTEESTQTKEAE